MSSKAKILTINSCTTNLVTVLILFGVSTSFSLALGSSVVAEFKLVQAKTSQVSDFSSKFTQIKYNRNTEESKKFEGMLEFKAPTSFRWEILSPNSKKELYVSNGNTLWTYSEPRSHARKLQASDARDQLDFLNVLFDLKNLDKRYEMDSWKADDALEKRSPDLEKTKLALLLKPKKGVKANGGETSIFLLVDKESGNLDEIRMHFNTGNWTQIKFSEMLKRTVAESRFEFIPPKGIVIDQK